MKMPKAVLISDIHFTPNTLDLASSALIQAREKARELKVPLILCGDTLDTKDIIRGVCSNRLIEILEDCNGKSKSWVRVIVLVGNHDMVNEKSEDHVLNFLNPYCDVVKYYFYDRALGIHFIPYQNDSDKLLTILGGIPTGSTIIAHQGLQTAFMGHYMQDKTSLPPEAFRRFRTISGHYHRHQSIECLPNGTVPGSNVGIFTYVGTPYTTSFSEANDGLKGFQILFDDGSLELVPTNLRKHVIMEVTSECLFSEKYQLELRDKISPNDLLWLKVSGPYSELEKLKKKEIGSTLLGHSNFKLDLIYTDTVKQDLEVLKLTNEEIFDKMISDSDETQEQKSLLKSLWREVLNANS